MSEDPSRPSFDVAEYLAGVGYEIVPVNQSQKIYDLLNGPKELEIIEGSGHAVHLDAKQDDVFRLILSWIKRHTKNHN